MKKLSHEQVDKEVLEILEEQEKAAKSEGSRVALLDRLMNRVRGKTTKSPIEAE